MSAPLTPGVSSLRSSEGLLERMRSFWQRISEGRQLDELWSQFTADARASYGFYMKEAEGLESQRGLRRLFGIAKTSRHAEALRVGGSFSVGGSHPANAEAARKRALLQSNARFSFVGSNHTSHFTVSVVRHFS